MLSGVKVNSSRDRVKASIQHVLPDRMPVDFLAVPTVWETMLRQLDIEVNEYDAGESYFDPNWEKVNIALGNDCRIVSYDQFIDPSRVPFAAEARCEWYNTPARSTPNRMFRVRHADGKLSDIWGRNFIIDQGSGVPLEVLGEPPLAEVSDLATLRTVPFPDPDWWDFSEIRNVIGTVNQDEEYHWRYRAGSIFEIAWQLMGMEKFMMDLSLDAAIPQYLMEKITDITIAMLEKALSAGGDQIDTVYFYDDVASQSNLLISRSMWRKYIRPLHQQLIDSAKRHGKTVMYHCDGNISSLIPELIDLGVDILNPIQPDIPDMDAFALKRMYGDRLCFHGGIDIHTLLVKGTPQEISNKVNQMKKEMLKGGGYIMASSHHIQHNTPPENILALYERDSRVVAK